MAFVAITLFQTPLTQFLNSASTTMRISSAAAAQISSALGPGDFTIFIISNGVVSEIVHCTGASGTTATIVRAQEGTTAQNFAVSTPVKFAWTPVGIQAEASGGTSGITIASGGATTVTGGPYAFTVTTPATALTASTGISVTGTFPNFTITNTAPATAVTPTIVTGSGVANVTTIAGGYNVDVPSPAFTSGTGISVTGTYPNFTITNTAPASGGTGTVTSVTAGTGISVTGSPTVTPTVGITPTGVGAGTYGGITVNASGQITAVSSSLLTGLTSSNSSISIGGPTAGVADIIVATATTAAKGIVQLATASSAGSSNPADSTSAVTPAGIAAVIAAQTPITLSADVNNIPLPAASYTNPILTSSISLNLASGKTAIVTCNVEFYDPINPVAIAKFGVGLFQGLTFIDGIDNSPASNFRTLIVKLTGPFTGTVIMSTTAPTGTEIVQSKSMTIVTN